MADAGQSVVFREDRHGGTGRAPAEAAFEGGFQGEDACFHRKLEAPRGARQQRTGIVLFESELRVGVNGMGHGEQLVGELINAVDDGLLCFVHIPIRSI